MFTSEEGGGEHLPLRMSRGESPFIKTVILYSECVRRVTNEVICEYKFR